MAWQLQYNVGGEAIRVNDIVISKTGMEGRVVDLRPPSGEKNDPGAVFVKWLEDSVFLPEAVGRPHAVYAPAVFEALFVQITDEAALREELTHALLLQRLAAAEGPEDGE